MFAAPGNIAWQPSERNACFAKQQNKPAKDQQQQSQSNEHSAQIVHIRSVEQQRCSTVDAMPLLLIF